MKNKFYLLLLLVAVAVIVTTSGCGSRCGKRPSELQKGDTVFIKVSGTHLMGVVEKNHHEHRIVTLRVEGLIEFRYRRPAHVIRNYSYSKIKW